MPKRTVVYDSECGFCSRSVRLMKRLDWLKRLEWRPRETRGIQGQIDYISPDGKTQGGFYAMRRIWVQLPLTFLPSLILFIPGVSLLGVPAYRWIARNRYRFGGKTASCEL